MEILLIRHGDPDYANDCLTALGRQEAHLLADALEGQVIDDIYVSPLGRAEETCAFTLERKDVTPVVLDWMKEVDTFRDGFALWQSPGETFLGATRSRGWKHEFDLAKELPEGCDLFERIGRGFNELMATYGYVRQGDLYRIEQGSGKRIALFCHMGVIVTLLSDLLHWPLPMIYVSSFIHPTGITRLELVERNGMAHFKLIGFNDLSHLA